MGDKKSANELYEALVHDKVLAPRRYRGFVKKSERKNCIAFALDARCGRWIDVPVDLIQDTELGEAAPCRDHQHPVALLTLADTPAAIALTQAFEAIRAARAPRPGSVTRRMWDKRSCGQLQQKCNQGNDLACGAHEIFCEESWPPEDDTRDDDDDGHHGDHEGGHPPEGYYTRCMRKCGQICSCRPDLACIKKCDKYCEDICGNLRGRERTECFRACRSRDP